MKEKTATIFPPGMEFLMHPPIALLSKVFKLSDVQFGEANGSPKTRNPFKSIQLHFMDIIFNSFPKYLEMRETD